MADIGLVVADDAVLTTFETGVSAAITALGHTPVPSEAVAGVPATDAIIICPSAGASTYGTTWKNAAIPTAVWGHDAWADFGLATGTGAAAGHFVATVATGHTLAAGYSGTQNMTTTGSGNRRGDGGERTGGASVWEYGGSSLVWAYAANDPISGGTAAAKRAAAGIFGVDSSVANTIWTNRTAVLEDIVDAFVEWLVEDINDPPVADAGTNQSIASGATVQVGGTGDLNQAGGTTGLTFAWTVEGGTGSFDDATLQQPDFTAGTGPYSATLRKTVTETATGLTASDIATVTVAAPVATNLAPTITSGTATPSSVTAGQAVAFHWDAEDSDGTIASWAITASTGVVPSSTTTNSPTVDTTGLDAGTHWLEAVATDDDGADSEASRVFFEVVAVGAAVGDPITISVTGVVPPGAATAQLVIRVRELDTGDEVEISETSISPTTSDGYIPGDAAATVPLEAADAVAWDDDGNPTVWSDWAPVATLDVNTDDGVSEYDDLEPIPGRRRKYRASTVVDL